MKITIIYDNTTRDHRLAADWGFSCLVEAYGRKILFDAGANGNLLINNMKYLGIKPTDITDIFLSHDHWDHTYGLPELLMLKRADCFVPEIFSFPFDLPAVPVGDAPREIHEGIWSTGSLAGVEHSLVVKQGSGVAVITGCSHPGVEAILAAAGTIGKVSALIGGLHNFDNIETLAGLSLVCPTHCTRHIDAIRSRHAGIYAEGGAGSIIEI